MIVLQGRGAEHIESLRQEFLTYHLLEGLTTRLHAMALQTVTENFMEEDATGRTRHDGRTSIWVGDRCIAKSLQSLHHVLSVSYHLSLAWEVFEGIGEIVQVERTVHAIRSHHRSGNHDTSHTAVLHDFRAIGIDEVVAIYLKLDIGSTLLDVLILLEDVGNLVQAVFPEVDVDVLQSFSQVLLVVGFHGSLGEARSLVLVVLAGQGLRLRLFQVAQSHVISAECLLPDGLTHGRDHLSRDWHERPLSIASIMSGSSATLIVVLEVIEFVTTKSNLWSHHSLSATIGGSHTEVALYHHGLGVLESQTHEIRSRLLLAERLHAILQFLLEGGEKRVASLPLRRNLQCHPQGEDGNAYSIRF